MAIELCVETVAGMSVHAADVGGIAAWRSFGRQRHLRTDLDIRIAVDDLPDRLRAPLLLVDRDGRSYADVGTQLGLSQRSVRRRVHAARRRVARQIS